MDTGKTPAAGVVERQEMACDGRSRAPHLRRVINGDVYPDQ